MDSNEQTIFAADADGLPPDVTYLLGFRRGRFRDGEFLEARIILERIEHRIEPEQRRSERHVFVECARARY